MLRRYTGRWRSTWAWLRGRHQRHSRRERHGGCQRHWSGSWSARDRYEATNRGQVRARDGARNHAKVDGARGSAADCCLRTVVRRGIETSGAGWQLGSSAWRARTLALLWSTHTFLMRKVTEQTGSAVNTATLRVEAASLARTESVAGRTDRREVMHEAWDISSNGTSGHANLLIDF